MVLNSRWALDAGDISTQVYRFNETVEPVLGTTYIKWHLPLLAQLLCDLCFVAYNGTACKVKTHFLQSLKWWLRKLVSIMKAGMYILEDLTEPMAHFRGKQCDIFNVLWAIYSIQGRNGANWDTKHVIVPCNWYKYIMYIDRKYWDSITIYSSYN